MDKLNIEFIRTMFKDQGEIIEEPQNREYCGCFLKESDISYRIRVSKQMPKKNGQFVVIWKKDSNNENTAYTFDEFPDYLIIFTQKGEKIGKFTFPRKVLKDKGILRTEKANGKMAFRVYPIWDTPENKQAAKTQDWQLPFFEVIQTLS